MMPEHTKRHEAEVGCPGDFPTRRTVIRGGAKAMWITPLILTFTAQDAVAAGSNHSCYPEGHLCIGDGTIGDGNAEPCCPGLDCTGPPPKTCK